MTRALACLCVLALASTADAEPKMLKGPYLQDLAPTSITVMWQMKLPKLTCHILPIHP